MTVVKIFITLSTMKYHILIQLNFYLRFLIIKLVPLKKQGQRKYPIALGNQSMLILGNNTGALNIL